MKKLGNIVRRIGAWVWGTTDRRWTDDLDVVHRKERSAIEKRWGYFEPERSSPAKEGADAPEADLVGLCLSGGGIRSAAFCLGAMQALDATDAKGTLKPSGKAPATPRSAFSYLDYLSSVSGGGYIATATVARMRNRKGFPFSSDLGGGEPPDLRRIRDRSNYLFPRREWALLTNFSIYLRGLFSNFLIVLPWMLLAAALTLFLRPKLSESGVFRFLGERFTAFLTAIGAGPAADLFAGSDFVVTRLFLVVLVVYFLIVWPLLRSWVRLDHHSEVSSWMTGGGRAILTIAGVLFVIELQPVVVRWAKSFDDITTELTGLTTSLAAASGVVAYFKDPLMKLAERSVGRAGAPRFLSRLLFALLGLPVPLLLWLIFIVLCAYGYSDAGLRSDSVMSVYLRFGVLALLASTLLSPNANSLHRLYRERIGRAFFEADGTDIPGIREIMPGLGPYLIANAAINLQASRFSNERGRNADFFIFSPYYTGSRATGYVDTGRYEKAWRDLNLGTVAAVSGAAASPNMGSNTLKLLTPTLAFLNVRLGYWIRNPRRFAPSSKVKDSKRGIISRSLNAFLIKSRSYFLVEAFGLLDEESDEVYLTDGGHIDNLGLYELLTRRCRLIIVVDAEADPTFDFPSFVRTQRYARIDHGIRMTVPWLPILKASKSVAAVLAGDAEAAKSFKPSNGPHCALGPIGYSDRKGDAGILLYVKASLTGDENDYVIDYARRNPSFPHETTVDQLFSEEQFEVYRALGFHALHGALNGGDCLAVAEEVKPGPCDGDEPVTFRLRRRSEQVPILETLRQALGLPDQPPPQPDPMAVMQK